MVRPSPTLGKDPITAGVRAYATTTAPIIVRGMEKIRPPPKKIRGQCSDCGNHFKTMDAMLRHKKEKHWKMETVLLV